MGTNIAATSRHNYFLSHKTKLLEFYELVRYDSFEIKVTLKLKHYRYKDRMSSCFKFFTCKGLHQFILSGIRGVQKCIFLIN